MARSNALRRLPRAVWDALLTNHLWKRLLKYTLAMTTAVTLAILPPVIEKFGKSTFLLPLQLVFAHPAQRVGSMIETQLLIVSGAMLGTGVGSLGLFLSSLVIETNPGAGYGIRAVFLLLAVIVHGYLRSSSPKLFALLFFLLMASFLMLAGRATHLTPALATSVIYPVLTGNGVALFFGFSVFPQFSGSFLGTSTIDILSDSAETLSRATAWFVASESDLEHSLTHQLTRPATNFSLATLGTRTTGKGGKYSALHSMLRSIFRNPLKRSKSEKTSKTKADDGVEQPLLSLTSAKTGLRTGLLKCKKAQREVNFELSVSALPLDILRPITTKGMGNLVRDIITVIGACENKLLMVGLDSEDDDEEEEEKEQPTFDEKSRPSTRAGDDEDDGQAAATGSFRKRPALPRMKSTAQEDFLEKLKLVKPSHEMEEGDAELLESILARIRGPVKAFDAEIQQAVPFLISCLAYCYDVPKLPSGAKAPKGILLEEMDLRIDSFENAIAFFDRDSMDEFKHLAAGGGEEEEMDILPRFETFLVSSFLMGVRQGASHILYMLKHMRVLVEARQARHDRARIYWPHYTSLRDWLSLGGEADGMVLPEDARKQARSEASDAEDEPPDLDGEEISKRVTKDTKGSKPDIEAGELFDRPLNEKGVKAKRPKARRKKKKRNPSRFMRLRAWAADTIEWVKASDDIEYALKLTVAVALVTWPGFLPSWHDWYSRVRGLWVPLQLVLVFEVAIGTSLFVFFMRLFGVVYGCTIGLAAFEIGDGDRGVAIVVLVISMLPCIYIQLETKYVKAGVVAMTTMMVVALASLNQNASSISNFYVRLSCFLIGGFVATIIELTLYPVRARDRLIESLDCAVREVASMQGAIAIGIDSPTKVCMHSPRLYKRFTSSRDKAQGALTAATTFLPFCLSEPRLKGDFKALVPVYREIIFVLNQIIDRLDTVLSLRNNYGSAVLEDLNPLVHAYRRNVAGGIALSLFAVSEALTTGAPLPQFLPSNRTAQLRLINRVRQLTARHDTSKHPGHHQQQEGGLLKVPEQESDGSDRAPSTVGTEPQIAERHKVLAWNASTAGQVEIIEYLEELVELAKLIVGVNAFRSGMLRKLDFGAEGRVRLVGDVSAYPSEDEDEDGDAGDGGRGRGRGGRRGSWAEEEGEDDYGLRRVATYGGYGSKGGGEAAEDAVPVTLHLVSSRLKKEASTRRRMSVKMGLGMRKGKGKDKHIGSG
ncbi:related to Lactobacillus putative histidine protein kinase SppK [Cephalotrichum gorgonifer]|uniref:Related to Lactobacillus putative histidine protein kinase SppK n=1 Tax=Cephalotrichum gorgonifer TaxID=2041049 RepID=A0AAE8MV71_9PEZI|nr:related to Lactobacillus putative histidine protein kinase SppK [Cephalotrichum gorgonifer]